MKPAGPGTENKVVAAVRELGGSAPFTGSKESCKRLGETKALNGVTERKIRMAAHAAVRNNLLRWDGNQLRPR